MGSNRKPVRRRRLAVECLEARNLLSATSLLSSLIVSPLAARTDRRRRTDRRDHESDNRRLHAKPNSRRLRFRSVDDVSHVVRQRGR